MDRPNVLIVDDNTDNLEYAQQVLEERYEVRVASTGTGALARTSCCPPDLVLLDISLPRRDGWSVLEEIREDPSLSKVPVVACTAHAMDLDRERCRKAGFDGYLPKPYRPRELLGIVASFLGPGAPTREAGQPGSG